MIWCPVSQAWWYCLFYLHPLKKCSQCHVLDGLVPCFPDQMVLLIIWLNVLNGWWSRMVWCTETWRFSKLLFNWLLIFLHHLKKCGQCLVLDGLVPCFPGLMVLLIVWMNVPNGWWSRMVWCTETWWSYKVWFNAECLFSCTIWRNVANS